ncbi:hypothetical protein P3X46_005340 [Hevea brasiliensis]|uniref:Uncharacterized protein n=1 Tax=Hevea brasiliensis TaxID=3981 RepID=A0ABQ9MZL7_HEVBR|nr:hypothetical protein P3X46_034851 [Hevea brasiliensis]KAJ9185746.1 hypothetical protein P3X46_005340 [Hevea brasiliensis]
MNPSSTPYPNPNCYLFPYTPQNPNPAPNFLFHSVPQIITNSSDHHHSEFRCLCHSFSILDSDNAELCFALDGYFNEFRSNFFYKDCPGVVNFNDLESSKCSSYLETVVFVGDEQPESITNRLLETGVMYMVLMVEHDYVSKRADEERKKHSNYKAIIEHDGLPSRQSSNQKETSKTKTREELLSEERDYKRRRMSYHEKKSKRTTLQANYQNYKSSHSLPDSANNSGVQKNDEQLAFKCSGKNAFEDRYNPAESQDTYEDGVYTGNKYV